jgi:hypothetical protein
MNVQTNTTRAPQAAIETPTERLMDLCAQIAEILDGQFGDQFDAVIKSNGKVWLKDAERISPMPSPEDAFDIAAAALNVAAQNLDPTITGLWLGRDMGPGIEDRGRISCITFDRGSTAHRAAMAARAGK